jgi:hypothetical protein
VAAHVREVWGRAAALPEVLDAMAEEARPATEPLPEFGIYSGLDLPYRVRRITAYLTGDHADPALLGGLIGDAGLPAALRLHLALNANLDRVDLAAVRATTLRALEEIRAGAAGDERIEALVRLGHLSLEAATIPRLETLRR